MSELKKYFDSISHNYSDSKMLLFIKKIELFQISRVLPDIEGKDVLEVGCGHGFYSRHLQRKNPRNLVLNDLSSSMIKYTNQKKRNHLEGDFLNVKMEERSFDYIFCFGAVEFIGALNFIEKSQKLLREGGKIIFLYPRLSLIGVIYRYWYSQKKITIELHREKDLELVFKKKTKSIFVQKIWPLNFLVSISK